MPRRDDLRTIVILGSGPIRIGQAAEFDFSGSQACRALGADGYEVILINSNPAIQNDPEMADRIYIEPLLPEVVKRILEIEDQMLYSPEWVDKQPSISLLHLPTMVV